MAAQRALKISHSTIKKYANVGGAYNGYIFSYKRLIQIKISNLEISKFDKSLVQEKDLNFKYIVTIA